MVCHPSHPIEEGGNKKKKTDTFFSGVETRQFFWDLLFIFEGVLNNKELFYLFIYLFFCIIKIAKLHLSFPLNQRFLRGP